MEGTLLQRLGQAPPVKCFPGCNRDITMTPYVLLGTAIGDAMGKPFETMDRTDQALRDWRGGTYLPGTHDALGEAGKKPGAWTDDTQMSLALAQALIDNRGVYDPAKAVAAYLRWYRGEGPGGTPRGIGGTLRGALTRLSLGEPLETSGKTYQVGDPVGCGTSMRAAVIGVAGKNDGEVLKWAEQDAVITHNHIEARAGSAAVALMVFYARKADPGTNPMRLVEKTTTALQAVGYHHTMVVRGLQLAMITEMLYNSRWWGQIPLLAWDSGMVWDVVPSAVACFLRPTMDSYREPLLEAYTYAIKMGGDTDSRAAITGAFIGALYGFDTLKSELPHIEDGGNILATDEVLNTVRELQ